MILVDFLSFEPWDELYAAYERVPSTEYSQMGSLKGRAICVWKTCYHAVALIIKPIGYIAIGILFCTLGALNSLENSMPFKFKASLLGSNFILTGLVAPIGQIMMLFKATIGIVIPSFYFKENELDLYFDQLANFAEEFDCEQELVDLLKNGASILTISQQMGCTRCHYDALFKRDLAIICNKLQGTDLSDDEKVAVLKMFASLPSDLRGSAINGCAPGIGRLLEQICASLDAPKNPKEVMPWLEMQIKQEMLNQIVMQHEANGGKYMLLGEGTDTKMDAAHFGNVLISVLGEEIQLPLSMIEKANQDIMVKLFCLPEEDHEELIELFNQEYTEQVLADYFIGCINSQPDGRPGLKDFRNYIIQALTEAVSEDEIEASKEDVQDKFKIGDALADDPIFYVKLHYFLYPDIDPSDEKSTDLNEEGIRAFAATLEKNPFDYFVENN